MRDFVNLTQKRVVSITRPSFLFFYFGRNNIYTSVFLRLSGFEKKINFFFLWQENIFALRLLNSKTSDSHCCWRPGIRFEVSISLCPLVLWTRVPFTSLQSPLKCWPLIRFWYPNATCRCKRRQLGLQLYFRMNQKWQCVDRSCSQTQQERALLTEGGQRKTSWWTRCGSGEGWRIGAINETNVLQSAVMGAIIHVHSPCQIHSLSF